MTEWLEIISVVLLSSVKQVLGGIPLAMAYGFDATKTIMTTVMGGMVGVLFFTYLSDLATELWYKLFPRPKAIIRKRRVFTKRNRMIVKVIKQYGLIGVAFLTPVLFSIPIGTFISTKIEKRKTKIFMLMFAACAFWSVLFSSIKMIF